MGSSGRGQDPSGSQTSGQREVSSQGRTRHPSEGDSVLQVLAGTTLGHYRLLCPIAAGGMAQVWAAKPEGGGLSRTVAIKLVRPEYAADEEYARMFLDEAMVASSVHHPNVCEIYELGREGDSLFMVFEWVAGDSLSGLVQRGVDLNPLPVEIAAKVASEACAGLHAAHEAVGSDGQPLGIVHRDVSPPNILISMHGQVKVGDFGIAKARHQLHARTRTGEIKGKFAYIAPEQILGRPVDRRADVYAMGCVLYVASIGFRPFGGGAAALGKIVQGNYRKPRELKADYPEGLQDVVVKALSTNPEHRYQSAEAMRVALEQWLLETNRSVVSGDISRVVRERMNPDRRRLVDAVLGSTLSLPELIAETVHIMQQEKTETPTATSGLVVQPKDLKRPIPRPHPAPSISDPDTTVVGPVGYPSATVRQAISDYQGSSEEPTRIATVPITRVTPMPEPEGSNEHPVPSEVNVNPRVDPFSEDAAMPPVRLPSSVSPGFRTVRPQTLIWWVLVLLALLLVAAYWANR